MPCEQAFFGEMATRLAAYAISALPIEEHAEWTERVQQSLPSTVRDKVRQGHIIKTAWNQHGVSRLNVPAQGSLQ